MGALRSILVALDGSDQTTPAIDLAFEWSVQFGARVVGVGLIDEPTIMQAEPVPLGAFAYKGVRDEARLNNARARVQRFLSDFEVRANAGHIPATTVTTTGSPADRILRETQRCDVLMIGRS